MAGVGGRAACRGADGAAGGFSPRGSGLADNAANAPTLGRRDGGVERPAGPLERGRRGGSGASVRGLAGIPRQAPRDGASAESGPANAKAALAAGSPRPRSDPQDRAPRLAAEGVGGRARDASSPPRDRADLRR